MKEDFHAYKASNIRQLNISFCVTKISDTNLNINRRNLQLFAKKLPQFFF